MDRSQSNPRIWVQRHNDFHDLITKSSGRPKLMADITRIRNSMQPYLLMHIAVYDDTEMEGFEHGALMEVLRSRKPKRIEATLRDHVMSAGQGLIAFLKSDAWSKNASQAACSEQRPFPTGAAR
jgi:DNA-binding GntR family transcriptional regulator